MTYGKSGKPWKVSRLGLAAKQIGTVTDTIQGTVSEIEQVTHIIGDVEEIVIAVATAIEEQSSATREIADYDDTPTRLYYFLNYKTAAKLHPRRQKIYSPCLKFYGPLSFSSKFHYDYIWVLILTTGES